MIPGLQEIPHKELDYIGNFKQLQRRSRQSPTVQRYPTDKAHLNEVRKNNVTEEKKKV